MGGWSLTRLRWEALRLYQRHGWAMPVLLLMSLASGVFLLQAASASLNAIRIRAALSEAASRPAVRHVEKDSAESLDLFYRTLPSEATRFAFLKSVLVAAEQSRVLPASADYKMLREPHTRLVRYQISLPLEGRWGDLQGFMKTVLSDHRSAVVDVLSLKRDHGNVDRVEGKLQISVLMVRADPVSPGVDREGAR